MIRGNAPNGVWDLATPYCDPRCAQPPRHHQRVGQGWTGAAAATAMADGTLAGLSFLLATGAIAGINSFLLSSSGSGKDKLLPMTRDLALPLGNTLGLFCTKASRNTSARKGDAG